MGSIRRAVVTYGVLLPAVLVGLAVAFAYSQRIAVSTATFVLSLPLALGVFALTAGANDRQENLSASMDTVGTTNWLAENDVTDRTTPGVAKALFFFAGGVALCWSVILAVAVF